MTRERLEPFAGLEAREDLIGERLVLQQDVPDAVFRARHLGDQRVVLGAQFLIGRTLVLQIGISDRALQHVDARKLDAGSGFALLVEALLLTFGGKDLHVDHRVDRFFAALGVELARWTARGGLHEGVEHRRGDLFAVDDDDRLGTGVDGGGGLVGGCAGGECEGEGPGDEEAGEGHSGLSIEEKDTYYGGRRASMDRAWTPRLPRSPSAA